MHGRATVAVRHAVNPCMIQLATLTGVVQVDHSAWQCRRSPAQYGDEPQDLPVIMDIGTAWMLR